MSETPKAKVLAFGAHPDDVEIFAGGTVCSLVRRGYRVGIVDLTAGELGSRGSGELRGREAEKAAAIMGVAFRENLGIPDGDIQQSLSNRNRIISALRRHRPDILLIPAPECRHPDHGAASRLIAEAAFYSGLRKVNLSPEDVEFSGPIRSEGGRRHSSLGCEPWRPAHILHYMQSLPFTPSVVVDVSDVWERRMDAVKMYQSQVFDPDYDAPDDEPETFISDPGFLRWIEARARSFGYRIEAEYGEPFLYHHGPMGTDDLVRFLGRDVA